MIVLFMFVKPKHWLFYVHSAASAWLSELVIQIKLLKGRVTKLFVLIILLKGPCNETFRSLITYQPHPEILIQQLFAFKSPQNLALLSPPPPLWNLNNLKSIAAMITQIYFKVCVPLTANIGHLKTVGSEKVFIQI